MTALIYSLNPITYMSRCSEWNARVVMIIYTRFNKQHHYSAHSRQLTKQPPGAAARTANG